MKNTLELQTSLNDTEDLVDCHSELNHYVDNDIDSINSSYEEYEREMYDAE